VSRALARRHRWADGTTHLVFEPLELLERLTALTPRPRINLLLYYGVLGAQSAWRSRLKVPDSAHDLMRRSFGFDVLSCPGAAIVSS
jgi:Putative transposase